MASFFEKIFGKKETQAQAARETFQMLTGYSPTFRTWTGGVFESELIRAALDAHGRHAAKLDPQIDGTAKPNLRSRLHDAPNDWQTWAQFLYRTAVVLYARNTAFIVPVLGEYEETNGIVTIVPNSWELVTYKGEPYIRFNFDNGKKRAIELSRVGILTRYQYKSELFGEDNDALKATLDLITIQNQGITENVKNSASYKFYGVAANFAKDSDLANERKRFDAENFAKEGGGILLFPNTYKDIHQITPHTYSVDAEQVKIIKSNVYDYFGINEDVIQNKAYGDAWLAFYEGAVEWFAINLSETLSKMLYTERERQFGNRIWFTSNRLQYMSNADKLAAISQLADRGLMTRNELRAILNLAPLPEPIGSQIPARGEYYAVNGTAEEGENSER